VQRFLVAYDGSESARQAAVMAAEMAKKHGASVGVICVGEYRQAAEARDEAEREARRLAEEGAAIVERKGVPATIAVRLGEPASGILQTVLDDPYDLIIMGHRGMTPGRFWMLGSVALKLVNLASCPVLVVRHEGSPAATAG